MRKFIIKKKTNFRELLLFRRKVLLMRDFEAMRWGERWGEVERLDIETFLFSQHTTEPEEWMAPAH